jgi:AraC-like DNA-binding protein
MMMPSSGEGHRRKRQVQRLSTRDIPPRDRLPFVHDFVSRNVIGLQFTPRTSGPPEMDLATLPLAADISVSQGFYTPLTGARTRDLLQDGKHNYFVTVHTDDYEFSVEGRSPVKVAAGDLTIVSMGMLLEFHLPSTRVDVLHLAHDKLAPLVPRIDMEPYYVVPANAHGAGLLTGYADLLRAEKPGTPDSAALAAKHLCELTALVLDGKADRERSATSIRAARLELVKTDILRRLRQPGLGVEDVARRQGVSVRYIHKLFETEGLSFSEYVRERRIELAYRMLENPAGERRIAAVAFDCGFGDISNFNRAFRRRYGMTPSERLAQGLKQRES